MNSILVLGSDLYAFLSCVRSYGKSGYVVHAAECYDPMAQTSSFIKELLPLPYYDADPDAWCKALNACITQHQYLLILPVDDASILKMKAYLKRYPDCPSKVYLLGDAAAEIVNDKFKTYELARRAGVPVADYAVAQSKPEFQALTEKYGYPFVLKPFSSFTDQNLNKKNLVEVIRSEKDEKKAQESFQKHLRTFGGVLIQEYFEGAGAGIDFLAHEGKILCAFGYIYIHEPSTGGGSSYRKSVKMNPALLADTQKLVKELHYTGVGTAEYKLNEQTNEYVLIEINGRFGGSLPLAAACGMDFPIYLLDMLTKQKLDFSPQYRKNYFCKNLQSDHQWSMQALGCEGVFFVLGEWCKSLGRKMTCGETFDEFCRSDNAIFWSVVKDNLKSWLQKPFQNECFRRFYRKHLLKKAPPTAQISSNDKVLFVCYGNICRSAFADRYRKSRTGRDDTTKSCGYYQKHGRPANDTIQRIAKAKYGVGFTGFVSTKLDASLMEWADYVICFDDKNYRHLTKTYRKYKRKVTLLGAFDHSASFIADPYWSEEAVFEQTLDRIASLIDRYLLG